MDSGPRAVAQCFAFEALGWAIYARWGKSYHEFIQIAAFGHKTDHWKFLSKFVELARDGKLTIWGKRDALGFIQEIPRSYWNNHGVKMGEGFPMMSLVSSGDDDPYRDLELYRCQVEAAWPHEGGTNDEG